MMWVRSNIKRASWVALFAMVIQFALSFGHFHAIASAPPAGSIFAQVANTQSGRQSVPNNDSDKHSDDICAICTVMAMANAISFAAPPALPLPQIGKFSRLIAESEFARVASTSVAFQPRAPPLS
jgi:hypothetical protein